MPAQILELIDKQDTFEIVRDQIAAILALESAKQQDLARLAGKDPALWKLRVFTERSNPLEEWLGDPDETKLQDTGPIVCVSYEEAEFDPSSSNSVERQKAEHRFHIDCFGYGVAVNTLAGHEPADERAAIEAQRALRLARNILMAGHYTYLGLRGVVWGRWPRRVQSFDTRDDAQTVQRVKALRLTLDVTCSEFSPQVQGVPLQLLSVELRRDTTTGQLLADAEYQYST